MFKLHINTNGLENIGKNLGNVVGTHPSVGVPKLLTFRLLFCRELDTPEIRFASCILDCSFSSLELQHCPYWTRVWVFLVSKNLLHQISYAMGPSASGFSNSLRNFNPFRNTSFSLRSEDDVLILNIVHFQVSPKPKVGD